MSPAAAPDTTNLRLVLLLVLCPRIMIILLPLAVDPTDSRRLSHSLVPLVLDRRVLLVFES